MPPVVTNGAALVCSFGMAPCALVVPPGRPMAQGRPIGVVTDITPSNIPTFGMCMSMANPQVAAATATALGVLTPMPCVPVVVTPWLPGAPTTLVQKTPALTSGSTCVCAYGGAISIIGPPVPTVSAT